MFLLGWMALQYQPKLFHIILMHHSRKLTRSIFAHSNFLENQLLFAFSTKNTQAPKVETVGFKGNTVHNYKKIAYTPKTPLQFINGKCLLYKNKRSLFEASLQSFLYTGPMAGIGYMLYTNPFADTFPASIPIFTVLELVILKLWLHKIRRNQNIVKQIYLLENGETTQIHYSNSRKRKLFGQPLSLMYYHSIFINPDFTKESDESLIVSHELTNFPASTEQEQGKPVNMEGYSWVKYFSNGENYFIIPKNAQYINIDVLSRIFQGKIIIAEK